MKVAHNTKTSDGPSVAELKKFGFLFTAFVCVIFGLLLPYLFSRPGSVIPWGVGGVVAVWTLIAPATLSGFYKYWIKFGNLLNFVNTRIILGLVFYVMFMPFGFVMRCFGHDPMQRKNKRDEPSFRSIPAKRSSKHQDHPY